MSNIDVHDTTVIASVAVRANVAVHIQRYVLARRGASARFAFMKVEIGPTAFVR